MPKPPLIKSPGRRSLALAGVMLGLFALSLAVSWVVTGAPLQRLKPPEPVPFELGGVEFSLNPSWQLLEETHASPGRPDVWVFINERAPSEQLRVIRLATTADSDPETVLQVTANDLLDGLKALQQIGARTADSEHHQAAVFIVTTVPEDQEDSEVYTNHAIATATPDGRRFWVYHLTDRVTKEAWSPVMVETWDRLIRNILDSAVYEPAPAAPPAS